MKIACIGWGSIIWEPNALPIAGNWQADGPAIPIEFARQAADGRILLVVDNKSRSVKTYWAMMATLNLSESVAALKTRERTEKIEIVGKNYPAKTKTAQIIKNWLDSKNIEYAIWSNLPPKFDNQNDLRPTGEQVVQYLKSLKGKTREMAEEYIRKAPKQHTTEYRQLIESELGWTPLEN